MNRPYSFQREILMQFEEKNIFHVIRNCDDNETRIPRSKLKT